ncbi:glycosyl hydrolase [Flavicella sediminum]|uniref:glycosyl hydrolase n=1 Tax=Flavicella sediminum TaxID=2585141 RepID=UPI0011235807|nr:glycosyl hydrolase [Flavicella sediminum]
MRPNLLIKFILLLAVCLFNCSIPKQKIAVKKTDVIEELKKGFKAPSKKYYPETWFHLNGNNISKEGLTLDLEAIKYAGLQGIHLFNKNGRPYPGVDPIKILSPEWEDMIRHAADECERLGLKFTMQNCPGWSMAGGPWVPVAEAQREMVETVYRFTGGKKQEKTLQLDPLYHTPDYDYKDIQLLAFPTPEGDDAEPLNPIAIETNNSLVPWKAIFNPDSKIKVTRTKTQLDKPLEAYRAQGISKVNKKDTWVKTKFQLPVTLRTIILPQSRHIIMGKEYPKVDVAIKVEALIEGRFVEITTVNLPDANWNDRRKHLTLAIPETTATAFVFTFKGMHSIAPEFIRLSSKSKLHNHEAKAAKVLRRLEKEVAYQYSKNSIVKGNSIVYLNDKMTSKGRLNWEIPEGNWTVVRFGHINMLLTNKPAVPEATGWESSKLDKMAIENHLRNGMIGNLMKEGGPIGNGKLHGLLIDSWESHVPTWTMNSNAMFQEFKQRRGYDLKKYLPATMGYIVDSPEITTKFLRDLRQTMDDLFIENFFQHFATIAHEMGAEVYTEGAGGEVLPIDPMRYYGVSDIPMTEFWYPKAPSSQNEFAKPILSAASATHLYNKPVLAAEACTQLGVKWNEHPFSVKYLIDYNFTKGVNHLVFHTFSHTPQTNVYPGSSFGGNIGFPFVRGQTWWKYMPDWMRYLARNQYMLQQGEYAADVLWYYGDHFDRPPFDLNDFPKGYRYDYLNEEILQEKIAIKNGKIHVKDGGDYRVILLRDSKDMLLSTAEKLKELVENGAVIVGEKPIDSPSLMDDDHDLKKLMVISNELWGRTESGVRQVGKGKVYWGKSIKEVLEAEKVEGDVLVPNGADINWIHRKTKEADLYFVSTKSKEPIAVSLSFRVENTCPQFWDAFTGLSQDAMVWSKEKGRTNVAVSLEASGSAILVFPKGAKEPFCSKVVFGNQTILSSEKGWYRQQSEEEFTRLSFKDKKINTSKSGIYTLFKNGKEKKLDLVVDKIALQNNWKAEFEKGWDTPSFIEVPKLMSLTNFKNEAVRHYSGTVSYTKNIVVENIAKRSTIDLGQVENIAELFCNGKKVGVRWASPYIFELSDYLRKGDNLLEVKVTNTWRNQLIYDHTRAKDQKKTWTTNGPKKGESKLEKSGLIGPVVLNMIEQN